MAVSKEPQKVAMKATQLAVMMAFQSVDCWAPHWVVCLVATKDSHWADKRALNLADQKAVKMAGSMGLHSAAKTVSLRAENSVVLKAERLADSKGPPKVVSTAMKKVAHWAVMMVEMLVIRLVVNLESCSAALRDTH